MPFDTPRITVGDFATCAEQRGETAQILRPPPDIDVADLEAAAQRDAGDPAAVDDGDHIHIPGIKVAAFSGVLQQADGQPGAICGHGSACTYPTLSARRLKSQARAGFQAASLWAELSPAAGNSPSCASTVAR
mgnify:CR=1 FL=1